MPIPRFSCYQQRWAAKRKTEIILQILLQRTAVFDVARQNDLTFKEVQEWIDTFLKAGEKEYRVCYALKLRP